MLSSKNILFFEIHYDSLHSPIVVLSMFSNSLANPLQDNSLAITLIQEPKSTSLSCSSRTRKPLERPWRMNADENQTWDIMSCLPSIKPLGNKFVFSIKLHLDGSIDCYKARLVMLGNKQEYGLDYDKTFDPVGKMTIVRTLLAFAASQS
ncbi:hypothetical protein CR513_57605, partial [Mucuna pruriens]